MQRNRQDDADLQALAAQIQEDTGCTMQEALTEARRQRPTMRVLATRWDVNAQKEQVRNGNQRPERG